MLTFVLRVLVASRAGQDGLTLLAGAAGAAAVWILSHRPAPMRPAPRAGAFQTRRSVWTVVRAGAGGRVPVTPRQVLVARWVVGVGAGLAWMVGIGNPLAAAGIGVFAAQLPELLVQAYARRVWHALDRSMYAFANVIRFRFQRGGGVLATVRDLAPTADQPARAWLLRALQADTLGVTVHHRLEQGLRDQAQTLHHIELALFADLLMVERERGPALEPLDSLVTLWGERIQTDAVRTGTILNTLRFGQLAILASLATLIFGVVSDPANAALARHGVGLLVYGAAVWCVTAALLIQIRTTRRAFQS
jgi:hypothetical protein